MPEEITTPTVEPVIAESEPAIESEETVEETSDDEGVDSETTNEPTQEEQGKNKSTPKAVRELIAVRKRAQQAEADAAYYKALAQAGSGQGLPPQAPNLSHDPQKPVTSIPQTTTAPRSEDFETWDEYESAKEAHLLAKAGQVFMQDFQRNMQLHNQQQVEVAFQQKIDKAAEENPVLKSIVVDQTMPISAAMAEVIKSSDAGPELLLYLHNNRTEAANIRNMSPIVAAKELGRIEAMLAAKPKPTPPRRVSMAPEPVKTVVSKGSSVIDEDKLPMDEWVKRRNENQFKHK
jgi:hypothetical protein